MNDADVRFVSLVERLFALGALQVTAPGGYSATRGASHARPAPVVAVNTHEERKASAEARLDAQLNEYVP
jgi:uncharacterized membrane protein YdbT with pleckstrin-like domain